MTDTARKIDPDLPVEIADALETAGYSPKLATLMNIIVEFRRMKEASAQPGVTEPECDVEAAFPLKALLPLNVSYRVGLDAAERGILRAFKTGGRWLCTKEEMKRWLAATGRSHL